MKSKTQPKIPKTSIPDAQKTYPNRAPTKLCPNRSNKSNIGVNTFVRSASDPVPDVVTTRSFRKCGSNQH